MDDEVPLMELSCHIRMFVFKNHHVAQINWNPSGILDLNLDSIRNPEADNEQVINAGRHLLSLLYDSTQCARTLDELRHQVFIKKKDSPKIKTLSPTEPTAGEHSGLSFPVLFVEIG